MERTASALVAQMQKWVGLKKADGSFQKILDIYNAFEPLPRGHKMTSTDAWCAATVSAAAMVCGVTDILPPECSCNRMIALFKGLGEWQENDKAAPEPGWILFYDWEDEGAGDNTGRADHVGVVEKVEKGVITVIEGNYSGAVKRRRVKVNGQYIRGYGVPRYDPEKPEAGADDAETTLAYKVIKGDTLGRIAAQYGVSVDELVRRNSGKYPKMTRNYIRVGWVLTIPVKTEAASGPCRVRVTAENGLNVRKGPATTAEKIAALPQGETATVLGQDEKGEWGMILYQGKPGWICLEYTREA